jgi:hypothetical protein
MDAVLSSSLWVPAKGRLVDDSGFIVRFILVFNISNLSKKEVALFEECFGEFISYSQVDGDFKQIECLTLLTDKDHSESDTADLTQYALRLARSRLSDFLVSQGYTSSYKYRFMDRLRDWYCRKLVW